MMLESSARTGVSEAEAIAEQRVLKDILKLQHHRECQQIPRAVKNIRIYLDRFQAVADNKSARC